MNSLFECVFWMLPDLVVTVCDFDICESFYVLNIDFYKQFQKVSILDRQGNSLCNNIHSCFIASRLKDFHLQFQSQSERRD